MFDIDVDSAWGATLGEGVTVLVVDYPVDYRHEDLRDNMDPADSPGLTEAAVVGSDTSHGTSMASIIAARDNAVGFRGVAPRAALTWRSINSVEIHSYLAVDDANTWDTCVEVIDADGSVAGTWVPSCESWVRKSAPAQYYTFSLDAPSRVTIDLRSSVDSYLYLRKYSGLSGGWTARDDDSGEGRNARFSRTLPAGVYTIEATTYERERRSGSFTLQIAGLDGASAPEAIESGRRWAPVWDSLLEAAVVNRSYGAANRTRPFRDVPDDDGLGRLSDYEVYDTMAEFGFDGRGTLNVVSGGKTFPVPGLVFWSTLAEERSHPAVVAACATDRNGRRDARSNTSIEGPNLWVCAPVGGMVYAILGDRYYLSTGTPSSPATALVSGVAALVRSIDASLSWRDVKLILAASAQHNDPGDAGWQQGAAVYGAAQQNYRYHHSYGFGVVDAGAAVQLAQNWRYLPEYRSEHISAPMLSPAPAVPDDGSTVAADLAVDPEIDFVEYVEAHLVLDAPWFRDLEVELESPSGTVSTLSVPVGDITNPALAKYDCKQASECGISGSFRFGTAAHLGEDPAGTWTLRLADRRPNGGANTLESWSLRFFGHKSSDPTPNLTPSPTFGPWPQVSIAAGADITEGDDVTFTITADPAPSEALDVTLSVTAAGDFGVLPGSHTVTIPTTGTAALIMATTDDSADEADGSVTATLRAVGGYTVSAAAGSASVAVADDDDALCDTADAVARARAAFVWHTDNNGGNEVLFWQILAYLGAEPMPAPPGGTVPASTTPEAVRAFSDGKTWPGWVPINAAMSCYTPPPVVSIAARGGVTEGGDATFTVSAVPAPSSPLTVEVAVAQSGDFGVTPGSRTVTVPTSGTATLTVATVGDSTDEPDGSVTATVGTGVGYTVSATAGSASVAVADDDGPAPLPSVCVPSLPWDAVSVFEVTVWRDGHSGAAHVLRWNRVLAALGADTGETAMTVEQSRVNESEFMFSRWDRVTRTLEALGQCDGPPPPVTPEVGIAAGGGNVTEGGDAVFTVTADPAPSSPLAVSVTVAQSGDFGAATGSRQVTVPTSGAVTLTVATANDGTDEADGSVTVTVDGGSGYTVSATAGTASVAVADDDPAPPPAVDPEVSITGGADVTEGGDATFTITADPAPSSPLTVTVTVSQSGDFGAATGSQSVTVPASGSAALTVATTNDSTDEADGSVTVTVDARSGYTVSQSAGTASVAVADDDDPPPNATPSLSISDASAGEGGTLAFTVTLSPASGRYVWVHYYARPGHGAGLSATFADFAQAYGMLTFRPGETAKTVTVAAVDDSRTEGDETFVVVLYAEVQAAVADREGTGTITDND
ncbi:S8 family serine peptidase [Candidatus Poriferisodalis sp.]|uniref:S8 family serine peptidase n=1 Tax=Candidatus Poriferisodalis sp. TaxID=3101277 RepID=UPI003B59251B